eukprot:scaffold13637_cov112-Isochrysis_galbana.AAC.2
MNALVTHLPTPRPDPVRTLHFSLCSCRACAMQSAPPELTLSRCRFDPVRAGVASLLRLRWSGRVGTRHANWGRTRSPSRSLLSFCYRCRVRCDVCKGWSRGASKQGAFILVGCKRTPAGVAVEAPSAEN